MLHMPAHLPPRSGAFSIHGLWPEYSNGSWPEYCARSGAGDARRAGGAGAEEQQAIMDCVWPSMTGPNEQFWDHEWYKHGTCSVDGVGNRATYFETVLRLHEKYNLDVRARVWGRASGCGDARAWRARRRKGEMGITVDGTGVGVRRWAVAGTGWARLKCVGELVRVLQFIRRHVAHPGGWRCAAACRVVTSPLAAPSSPTRMQIALARAGVVPSSRAIYSPWEFQDAVRQAYGVTPLLACNRGAVVEIWMCMDMALRPQACPSAVRGGPRCSQRIRLPLGHPVRQGCPAH